MATPLVFGAAQSVRPRKSAPGLEVMQVHLDPSPSALLSARTKNPMLLVDRPDTGTGLLSLWGLKGHGSLLGAVKLDPLLGGNKGHPKHPKGTRTS